MTMNQYGFEQPDWDAAKIEATNILMSVACNRARIPYSELMAQITSISLDAHDPRVSHFLDEISTSEEAAGRGFLTAIVVHKHGDMQPGPGFFDLAQRHGRDTSDILQCWVNEFNRVHNYWAN